MSCRPRKLGFLQLAVSLSGVVSGQSLHEEWPLGKLVNPSSSMPLSFCLQMVYDTKRFPFAIRLPNPPIVLFVMAVKSGWHRLSKSGLALPNKFFIPSVKKKTDARASANPSQPVFHSQSLLLKMAALGVPLRTVGPGTKRSDMKRIITAGATNETTTSTAVDTFSLCT